MAINSGCPEKPSLSLENNFYVEYKARNKNVPEQGREIERNREREKKKHISYPFIYDITFSMCVFNTRVFVVTPSQRKSASKSYIVN